MQLLGPETPSALRVKEFSDQLGFGRRFLRFGHVLETSVGLRNFLRNTFDRSNPRHLLTLWKLICAVGCEVSDDTVSKRVHLFSPVSKPWLCRLRCAC